MAYTRSFHIHFVGRRAISHVSICIFGQFDSDIWYIGVTDHHLQLCPTLNLINRGLLCRCYFVARRSGKFQYATYATLSIRGKFRTLFAVCLFAQIKTNPSTCQLPHQSFAASLSPDLNGGMTTCFGRGRRRRRVQDVLVLGERGEFGVAPPS
jgi:hypothetical protein